MSQNGPYDGMGNGNQQGPVPGGQGGEGGQWPGQSSGYPPAGSSFPSAGTPQAPAGWDQQGQPPAADQGWPAQGGQGQPSGQGWQGQPPVYPSAGTPQGPAPDWGQQPSGQGWQGQPTQQQPAAQGWQGQPGGYGDQQGYNQQGYNQQGYDQPGYDQQGYGAPPAGNYPGGPQQPWGYPPDGGQNQPRRGNKAVLGVVGGVVGLALVGGTVWAVNNRNSADPTPSASQVSVPSASVPSNSTSVPPPTVATVKASDAVTAYLQALAIGDSMAALSLAAVAPAGDTTFLDNKVLATTTRGKLTDIQVAEVTDPNATSVDASYTLNGKQVTTTFGVTKVGDQFRLNRVAASVDISRLPSQKVAVALAGVKPTSTVVNLFPGVYRVTAANKYFSYGTTTISVTDLEEQTTGQGKVSISSSGKTAAVRAAKAKFSACLKKHQVKPSGCGFAVRVPTGVKLRTSTIKWTTRSAIKWSKVSPKLVAANVVEAKAKGKVHFYARDARVSGRYWYKDVTVTGFMAKISGSKVTVSFY